MKKHYLFLFVLPLLVVGCNKQKEEVPEYKIVSKDDITELERQHNASLRYLNTYSYSYHHEINAKDLYLDKNIAESTSEDVKKSIGIYRGIFVYKDSFARYIGNNSTVGSKEVTSNTNSYWFIDGEDETKNLVRRDASTVRDQQEISTDNIIQEGIESKDTEYYFSGKISSDPEFSKYLNDSISTLTNPVNMQISENEIVSKGYEIKKIDEIKNLSYPNDERMNLVVFGETTTITKYSFIAEINSYVCSYKSEIYSKFIVTDNNLNTLKEKNVLESFTKEFSYSYSNTPLSYTGTPFFYKEPDKKQVAYAPVLVSYDNLTNTYSEENVSITNITNVYRNLNASFKGYAFAIQNVSLNKEAYCVSTRTQFDEEVYEVLGFSNIVENAIGCIGKANIPSHPNLFKNNDLQVKMEIIITIEISATNVVSGGLTFRVL